MKDHNKSGKYAYKAQKLQMRVVAIGYQDSASVFRQQTAQIQLQKVSTNVSNAWHYL